MKSYQIMSGDKLTLLCLLLSVLLRSSKAGFLPQNKVSFEHMNILKNIDQYPVINSLPFKSEPNHEMRSQHVSRMLGQKTLDEEEEEFERNEEVADCYCGKVKQAYSERIVGGKEAKKNQFPWQAGILLYRPDKDAWSLICGGSLISSRHVITAAHCLNLEPSVRGFLNDFAVTLGRNNIKNKDEKSIAIRSALEVTHPLFKGAGTGFDIGIIILSSEVSLTDYPHITPICLLKMGDYQLFENWVANISGWGLTSYGGKPSDTLLYGEVTILPVIRCGLKYHNMFSWSNICAYGGPSGTLDSCSGDSGGPLSVKIKNTSLHVGIVSWGVKCATPGYPGVYTRTGGVIDFVDFVKNYTLQYMFEYSVCKSDLY